MPRPKFPKFSNASEGDRRAIEFGKGARNLTDADIAICRSVAGHLVGQTSHYLRIRLEGELEVSALGQTVKIPPASSLFMKFLDALESVARGGDATRLHSFVDVMQQLGKGEPADPKRAFLLSLYESFGANVPTSLTRILRLANEKRPGMFKDLTDVRTSMKEVGMRATLNRKERGKPFVDRDGRLLRGLDLVSAAIREADRKQREAHRKEQSVRNKR